METRMGSCWKIFPLKSGEKDRLIWRPGDVSLNRKENGFPRNQKRDVFPGFSLSVSFRCKTVRSVSSVASAMSPENQTLVESEETGQILAADQPKTAHIRFKLTKECAFGQHFLVVGDDPCLGLWDPSDGVPFDWSDGHVWTTELDVPCGKVIKYKFILKVDDNTISWQPGPDRILETWETEKTITVFEDWDHPHFQDIAEEKEVVADINDAKSLISSDSSESLTGKNLSEITQDEGTDVKKQLVGTNEHSSLDDTVKQDLNSNTNYSKHEEISVLEQEAPVLLPGLIPTLTDETDEESPNTVEDEEVKQDLNSNTNYSKHEGRSDLEQEAPVLLPGLIPTLTDEESPNTVENEEQNEQISASLRSSETSKAVTENEKGVYEKEQLEISEADMQWGRGKLQGMLQKFLSILGF